MFLNLSNSVCKIGLRRDKNRNCRRTNEKSEIASFHLSYMRTAIWDSGQSIKCAVTVQVPCHLRFGLNLR
jgi:hypothetical protein